jgi:anti-sigma regulatory factor (Ser/Thr protein kinase)
VADTRVRIREEVDLNRAVLEARRRAEAEGFDATTAGKIATAVSELTRNILKYADHGEVRISLVEEEGSAALEVVVSDKGPGIEDLEAALADHYSSSGTLGLGLPGVRRLMDEFELSSDVGVGTRVRIRKYLGDVPRRAPAAQATVPYRPVTSDEGSALELGGELDIHIASRPCAGEHFSGDAAVVVPQGSQVYFAVLDVLGHGREANEVATPALRELERVLPRGPVAALEALDGVLRGTRGAAATAAVIDEGSGEVRCAGVGNVRLRVLADGGNREMPLTGGVLGQNSRSISEHRLQLRREGEVLLLASDGVKTGVSFKDYPQARYQSARAIARTVVRRFSNSLDDATCLALRFPA